MTMKKIFLIWTCPLLMVSLGARTGAQTPTPSPATARAVPTPAKYSGRLDVNKATRAQLTALGLSDAAADRVIQGRPYHRKSELLLNVLSGEEFARVQDRIFAWSPVRGF
jgi:hypothetical protein